MGRGGAAPRCSTGRRPAPRASGPAAGGPGRSGRSGRPPGASTTGRPDGRCGRSCIPGTCRTRCRRRWAAGSSGRRCPARRRGTYRDRGGLAAYPAPAVPAVMAAAPLADPLPGGVAAGDRLDHAAVRAGRGDLAGGARLAHAPAGCAVKRYPGPAAARACGQGQGLRPAGDQLGGQPPGHRRRAAGQRARIGGQCRGELAERLPGRCHRGHRGFDHRPRQRRLGRRDQPGDRLTTTARAGPPRPAPASSCPAGQHATSAAVALDAGPDRAGQPPGRGFLRRAGGS